MTVEVAGPQTGTDLKRQVVDLARQFIASSGDDSARTKEVAERLKPLIARLAAGVFRIVVMGEVKKGKSSFINALLGRPGLLPFDTDVATSTVYKVVYGSIEKYTVFFDPKEDGSQPPKPLEIPRERLAEFGTEAGNPGNHKNVVFIAIELPNALLREGIVIVDTPGVGGLFKKHREITFRYAPNSDAVFFVLDSVESVIGADEIKFLKELRKTTEQIFFLQTKTDAASEEQCEAWHARNLDVLAEALERPVERIPYFPISSKLKEIADREQNGEDLEDSGYLAVLQFLRNVLIPRRDAILAQQAAAVVASEVNAEGNRLIEQRTIAAESNKAKLEETKNQFAEAQQKLKDWQNVVVPRCKKNFQDETMKLRRQVSIRIQDAFSPDNDLIKKILEQVEADCKSAEQVYATSEDVLASFASESNQWVNGVLLDFDREFRVAFERTAQAAGEALGEMLSPCLEITRGDIRREDSNLFDPIRFGFMNLSAFGAISGAGSYAVSWGAGALVAAGLLSNPIGWAIATGAGVAALATTIWSAVRGYSSVRDKQKRSQIDSLERALREVARRAHVAASRALEEIANELTIKGRDAFDAHAAETREELDRRICQIAQAQSRTEEETRKVVAALDVRIKSLADLLKNLRSITARPEAQTT